VLLISLVDASRISSIEKSLGRERQRRNTISPTLRGIFRRGRRRNYYDSH